MTKITIQNIDELLSRVRGELSKAERDEFLEQILEISSDASEDISSKVREAFLILVRNSPDILEKEEVSLFLAEKIEPQDFDALKWESPEHMLEFCEVLYGFQFSTEPLTKQVRNHVQVLLRRALQQYEQNKEWEELFLLLQIAPTSPIMQDIELTRLRHLAKAYEIRRVRRNQRWLYAYLIVQVAFVVVVFPFLFINAENGALQRQIGQMTDVELGDKGYRLLSYMDGLYWSIVTASSIGYGDVIPITPVGRILAGVLGTMGVVTIGVMAGLILKWITPRDLD